MALEKGASQIDLDKQWKENNYEGYYEVERSSGCSQYQINDVHTSANTFMNSYLGKSLIKWSEVLFFLPEMVTGHVDQGRVSTPKVKMDELFLEFRSICQLFWEPSLDIEREPL